MNLLSCPFCGGSNLNNHASFMGFIGCDSCHTLGPNPQGSNDHITAWNTRTPPPTVWHRASEKPPTEADGDFAGAVWMFCQGEDFTTRPYHEISVWARIMAKEIYWARTGITKPKPPEV